MRGLAVSNGQRTKDNGQTVHLGAERDSWQGVAKQRARQTGLATKITTPHELAAKWVIGKRKPFLPSWPAILSIAGKLAP
jgi:hypothetical protein